MKRILEVRFNSDQTDIKSSNLVNYLSATITAGSPFVDPSITNIEVREKNPDIKILSTSASTRMTEDQIRVIDNLHPGAVTRLNQIAWELMRDYQLDSFGALRAARISELPKRNHQKLTSLNILELKLALSVFAFTFKDSSPYLHGLKVSSKIQTYNDFFDLLEGLGYRVEFHFNDTLPHRSYYEIVEPMISPKSNDHSSNEILFLAPDTSEWNDLIPYTQRELQSMASKELKDKIGWVDYRLRKPVDDKNQIIIYDLVTARSVMFSKGISFADEFIFSGSEIKENVGSYELKEILLKLGFRIKSHETTK